MFGSKDDLYCQGVIQKLNIIVSGSITGMIRLLDATDMDKLRENPNERITELYALESGVRTIIVSKIPEEKFIALGTEKGHIHVYETHNFVNKYKYHEFYHHEDKVWNMQFIQKGNDFLLVAASQDSYFSVSCLKERTLLHKFYFEGKKLFQCIWKEENNLLLVRRQGFKVFKLELKDR